MKRQSKTNTGTHPFRRADPASWESSHGNWSRQVAWLWGAAARQSGAHRFLFNCCPQSLQLPWPCNLDNSNDAASYLATWGSRSDISTV